MIEWYKLNDMFVRSSGKQVRKRCSLEIFNHIQEHSALRLALDAFLKGVVRYIIRSLEKKSYKFWI